MAWKNTQAGLEVEPGLTWPYNDFVVMPPLEQGVTPKSLAWLFNAADYNDAWMIWLDNEGKLIGNSRLPERQSQLIGIDKDLAAYVCSNT